MNLEQLLSQISSRGIKLSVAGDELKIRAPKGALTPDLRDTIVQNKPELLKLLQQKSNNQSANSLPLVPVQRNGNLPLSFQQERLWSVHYLLPNSSALNVTQVVQLTGKLNIPVLQASVNEIVNRHETLRTTLSLVEGSFVQTVIPNLDVTISVEDYRSSSSTQQASSIKKLLETESQYCFELEQAPLFRLKLLRLTDTEAHLIFVLHHIICDALSNSFLIKELLSVYDALLEGKPSPLPELEIQYGDYAVWQRKWLQGEVLESGKNYWKEQLTGTPSLYPVPIDCLPMAGPNYQNLKKSFKIPRSTWSIIQQLSNQKGLSPFMVLLSVFYVLILKYSEKSDFVVGVPVSNRPHHKLESSIGCFADLILLRANISGNLTFEELVTEVQKFTLKAYANQHIPFNYVFELLEPPKHGEQYRNIFQILFDYINVGEITKSYSNFSSTLGEGKAPLDIDIFLALLKLDEDLVGELTYNASLFEEDTISSLIDSYLLILQKCTSVPKTRLNEIELSEKLKVKKAEINSISRKQAMVKAALSLIPGVEDGYVMARDNELVAYVVSSGNLSIDKIRSHLQSNLPPELVPCAYVPVSILPLTASGKVDEKALETIEVIDSKLIENWEKQLLSHPQIEQAAVVVQAKQSKTKPPVHLLDLIPEATPTVNLSATTTAVSSSVETSQLENQTTFIPAFSDGGQLIIPEAAPLTLTEALIKTATQYQHKEIVYILSDGQQVSQTYSNLLSEAKCTLNGLRDRGLKAGDRIILQIESLRDYFPTLWGCILGGIQPVTVAVAKTYQQSNAIIKKLYNTWELLEHPPILASESLLEQLQNLPEILPFSELQIFSVERMRNYPTTEEIYHSQPDDVAFLQLTSGSTGVPKCIQETHQGIITHIHAAQQFNGYQAEDISLNWLPVDHVVPILTCHFKDTYLGCQQIEVATDVVLANPTIWLDLMEKYQVSHSWTPNFGFKLVSDALLKIPHLTWDLSSVKFLMNAGEQVTPKVVTEFMKLVAPFGISSQVMQPAFGMAEVCTCMTYQNQFDGESGIHRIQKASLGGKLVKAETTETDVIEFTDLGAPVPGVQIRITDENNKVLPEGVIGRFQIKGKVVTPGYLNNPEANSEAFVGDGWFNSGDLGFILDGKLVLTGREKELIIINGVNYYCYEIEDIVNNIEGVEPTFAGAVSFNQSETGTEGLTVFFTPKQPKIEDNIELIKTIRREISSQIGITPTYIIPLSGTEFPKTTSGKIQRGRLKKMLLDGECQEVIKEIDILLENNIIPNWFYRQIWRPKEASVFPIPTQAGITLIFVDGLELGSLLSEKLEKCNQPSILVSFGSEYVREGDRHYTIAPTNFNHYQQLFESIAVTNTPISRILHLGYYEEYTGEINDVETLEKSQNKGVYSLVNLVQALEQVQGTQHRVQLLFIASYTQLVKSTDKIASEKATVLGLLKTIPQEFPWLSCTHLDLPVAEVEVNGDYIWQELCNVFTAPQIAYREGKRMVSGLETVGFASEAQQELPLRKEGIYLISGGLGGIGVEIARYMLEHYQAKLILLGRTALEEGDNLSEKMLAYQKLQQLSGEVIYQAVDICNLEQVQQVVTQSLSELGGSKLDGIIHLAGIYHEQLLSSETQESIAALLRPKVVGTWVLHQLLKDNTDALFIHFSSIYGFFGATALASYSAANSFQTAFCDHQKTQGYQHSYCLAWSIWDEVGMSQGYKTKEFSRAKGYYAIAPSQGMYSLLVALCHYQNNLLVGLDNSKAQIQRLLWDVQNLQELPAPVIPVSKRRREPEANLSADNLPPLDSLPCEVDDIATSTQFETWADLLPGTENPAIISTDSRKALTHKVLKQFVQSPPENASLNHLGIKITDRVCSAIPNGPEAAVAFLSLAQQCVFAPISPSLTEKQVIFELEDLGAVALVLQRSEATTIGNAKLKACAESLGVRVIELIPDTSVCGVFTLEEVSTTSAQLELSEKAKNNKELATKGTNKPTRNHVALVLHTSGTTKRPKTVPLTHGNLTAGALTISRTLNLTPEDTAINIMPLFHIHGLSVNVLASVLAGASVLCTPGLYATENGVGDFFRWLNPETGISNKTITWYSAVPTMHQAILEYAEQMMAETGKAPSQSLKLIRNCSAALLPTIAERMATLFNCEVLPTYAMTESMPICSPEVGQGLAKRGSVGRAAGPQVIIGDVKGDNEGKTVLDVLPFYAEGEVMVRGACVTAGYELRDWMDSNPNEEAFIQGWLRTGDKGYMDEDGYVYLVGRFKEIINRAGEKISPMQVEDVLQRHPAVGQVVVFAAPHELLGEVVGAAIVPVSANQSLPSLVALRQFAMEQRELEAQWLPECLVWMSAIPKGLTGKPARIGLAKRLGLSAIPADATAAPRTFAATEQGDGKFVLEAIAEQTNQMDNRKGGCYGLQQLTAYFTAKITEFPVSQLQDLEVRDRFGTITQIVPSALTQLESFPLTTNGEIDRKRLQSTDKNISSKTEQKLAETETEQKIAAIWQEILQLEEVGIYDNFFELGGQSILLIKVYGKLQEIFDFKLKVIDLITHPTVHSLAQFIAGEGTKESSKKREVNYDKRLKKRSSKNERSNIRKQIRNRR